ncbi:hypothetical protein H072_9867 [Dactylellina haptotyla CBS 200.50]|uniref:Uncharacterized protein n=1 Tax=Dactylellina haptotyla (strain CBS 200.50) TaxID=1284197 RepID=S8A632_DACHA|nr:hypothetical protein H072_9867 [Dactylellina haptotyla CBS 200.50]
MDPMESYCNQADIAGMQDAKAKEIESREIVIMTPDPPIMTLEDLERELAGKPLSEPTKTAMTGSFNNLLQNIENMSTQTQILKTVAPFFPTTTERGMAVLASFVHGIIGNWSQIKDVLIKKGVDYLMLAIDAAWQSFQNMTTQFWDWLSGHWEEVLQTALTAVGGALGGIGGTMLGLHIAAGVRLGAAAAMGGPVALGVALIGTAIGTEFGGEIGGLVGKVVSNTFRK